MATILDTHSASMLYLNSISDILTKTVFLQLFLLLFILKSHDMVKIDTIIFEIVEGRGFFKQPPPPQGTLIVSNTRIGLNLLTFMIESPGFNK